MRLPWKSSCALSTTPSHVIERDSPETAATLEVTQGAPLALTAALATFDKLILLDEAGIRLESC